MTGTSAVSNYRLLCFTALLFLSSNALFAVKTLQPAPAALVLAGCAGVILLLWRSGPGGAFLGAPLDFARLRMCLLVGLALCLLGGEGHFFYANLDWLTRDAVLADLVREGATPVYQYDGRIYFLRAPLGMYMLPAAIGRAFGLFAAHLALLSMNAVVFGAILYLCVGLAGSRTPALFLAVIVGFGGLDILGDLAARAASLKTGEIDFSTLEWWSRVFAPGVKLQYSSMVTQIFWVPNHAAPGWFIALLVLLQTRKEITLATLAACAASLVLWSPLAVVGAAPFLVVLAARTPLREIVTPDNFFAGATGLAFLPVALYLLAGSAAVSHGAQAFADGFAKIYIPFLIIEIPQALILFYLWRRIEPGDRSMLVVAVLTLCLLPLFSFGPSNDLVLRASITSLFLLAFCFARVASPDVCDNRFVSIAVSLVLMLSVWTPAVEIEAALNAGKFAVSDCNMLTIWQSTSPMGFPGNYLASTEDAPDWLIASGASRAPAQVEYRDCWPDHPYRDGLRRDEG